MRDFFSLVLKSRLFWIGLVIKCVLMPIGDSSYLRELFIPFLERSIQQFGSNPWALGNAYEFPYGSILYAVMVPFKLLGYWILGESSLGFSGLSYTLFKLPLLVVDVFLLFGLYQLSGRKLHRLLVFYWLNPVLIFISYWIGQLDVVCLAFLIWSLVFLIEKRVLVSSVLFGFAILCKFHVALLIPFLMAYIWNNYFRNEALARIAAWGSFVVLVGLLGFAPHLLAGSAGYASAGSPEAQRIFSMVLQLGQGGPVIYLGVFTLLLLIGRLCVATKITPSGLVYGCGALMATLVLTVNPAEGWFFWFLPFVALLYAQYLSLPRLLYLGLSLSYFGYFLISKIIPSDLLSGILLTALQTFTACFVISFFIYVLKYDAPIFRRLRPFMIGIGGDSGAGKNYLTENIKALFGSESTRTIEGDDYHKWERGSQNWKAFTHLNPLANNLDVLLNHSIAMKRGQSVDTRHYDHKTGRFSEVREIAPAKIVIFQGLHALYNQVFREKLDLQIFLKPTEDVRKSWKVKRDVAERGHSPETILTSMDQRQPDSQKHILPQEEGVDWSMSYGLDSKGEFFVKHKIRNNPSVNDFMENLKTLGCQVQVDEINSQVMTLTILGNPERSAVSKFAETQFSALRQILRTSTPPVWKPGLDGVNQLILIFLLSVGSEDSSWL